MGQGNVFTPVCHSVHMGGLPRVGGFCIQGRSAFMGSVSGGSASREGWADPPPRDTWDTMGYGLQPGGTHPTEMHSCKNMLSLQNFVHNFILLTGLTFNCTAREFCQKW